jgi:hypothetical protein
MPVFNDSEPQGELLPEGDYLLTVESMQQVLSRGPKTAGADVYEFKFRATKDGRMSFVKDNLIDAPSSAWKLDIFLKACGLKLAKGEPWEFAESVAAKKGCKWIDPLQLRCWAHVYVDTYKRTDGSQGQSNKVGTYLLNKGVVAAEPTVPEEEEIPF